ncbi:MAG TPA: TIR domain-containing protein [Verrucomicrobiae bacterium]|nr:TIR domain-containing protein [Verrucomicrobiae bacterium]
MADVFISYVSEDRATAEKISRGLEDAGYSVWWDRHIHGGVDFSTEIERQLNAAKVVVVLWSAASLDSKWVRDEAQQARDENKLIPLRLDGVQPPLGFRQAQSLDFRGWNGDPTVGAFAALVDSARDFVDRLPTDAPRAVPTAAPKRSRWRGPRIVVGVVAVLALALAYFGVERFWPSKPVATEQPVAAGTPTIAPAATAIPEKSIAVLPFTDMSEKHDQEYLADGMAEEILNLLAQVPDLLVPARTSSFYFKGKPTKVPDIARELGVVNVLEGSIRRSGDHLRVTAQLVRADNGYHLWSETYDRELRDVFKVQDDIANAVVQALQIKLMGGELSRRKGGTENLEAYQLYLRALSSYNQLTESSMDATEKYLDQAIKLDPSYGMAQRALAANALAKTMSGMLDPAEGYERARQQAQRALQVSPDLAEAHSQIAWVFALNWDWAAAQAEVQRALAIDPTNPYALRAAGMVSLALGRWDDAERQYRAALARDPLNRLAIKSLGDVYYLTGRYAEAEAMYRRELEVAPDSMFVHVDIGGALLLQGKPEAALAMVQQDVERTRPAFLPIVLQANGRMAEADAALQALIAQCADRCAYAIALNYAYRDDHDLALQWLERAYQQKEAMLQIVGEPLLKNLADDPRYKAFLRKMKLPE